MKILSRYRLIKLLCIADSLKSFAFKIFQTARVILLQISTHYLIDVSFIRFWNHDQNRSSINVSIKEIMSYWENAEGRIGLGSQCIDGTLWSFKAPVCVIDRYKGVKASTCWFPGTGITDQCLRRKADNVHHLSSAYRLEL